MGSLPLRDEDLDNEAAMRNALAEESAEVLRHQLRSERDASVRLGRGDLMAAFFLAGIGLGVGFAGARGSGRRPPGKKLRSGRSR